MIPNSLEIPVTEDKTSMIVYPYPISYMIIPFIVVLAFIFIFYILQKRPFNADFNKSPDTINPLQRKKFFILLSVGLLIFYFFPYLTMMIIYYFLYSWGDLSIIIVFIMILVYLSQQQDNNRKIKELTERSYTISKNFSQKGEAKNTLSYRTCSGCGRELEIDALFCHYCGIPKNIEVRFCPYCGYSIKQKANYCHRCGNSIGKIRFDLINKEDF